jgi:hypothetical protein
VSWLHLAKRFAGSLRPGGPAPHDERWACEHLNAGEVALWRRMPNPDRRHAVGVARRVVDALGPGPGTGLVPAALLHDVGKIESGLRTGGRVVATLAGKVGGWERARSWAGRPGLAGRIGTYLRHPEVGADLLARAGSAEATVTWAREHHQPRYTWSLPAHLASVLAAADGD